MGQVLVNQTTKFRMSVSHKEEVVDGGWLPVAVPARENV